MADVKTEGDKGLNGLLRGRIKQDQNVNVGGRARLNHRPMHTEHIVGSNSARSSVEMRTRSASPVMPILLLSESCASHLP